MQTINFALSLLFAATAVIATLVLADCARKAVAYAKQLEAELEALSQEMADE